MRIVLLIFTIVFNFELFGMQKKRVYFDMVHNGFSTIVAKISSAVNSPYEQTEELSISSKNDSIRVFFDDTVNSGIVSIYPSDNDDQNPLLTFEIQKNSRYSPATVKFLNVESNTKAVLYRPSMGGGDRFILAIGKEDADVSSEKMQQSLPFGSIQFFIPVCSSNDFGR